MFQRQPRAWAKLNDKAHFLHAATPSRLGVVTVLPNTYKKTERDKQNEQREVHFQKREQGKTPGKGT